MLCFEDWRRRDQEKSLQEKGTHEQFLADEGCDVRGGQGGSLQRQPPVQRYREVDQCRCAIKETDKMCRGKGARWLGSRMN